MVIYTDLSEVLISGIYGMDKGVAKLYGPEWGDRWLERHLETDEEFGELLRGHITEDAYWTLFLQGMAPHCPATLVGLYYLFNENLKHIIPGTRKMYQRIISHPRYLHGPGSQARTSGMPRIYVVSDHIRERVPYVKDIHRDTFRIISESYWSFDFGRIKSDPGFFRELLMKTQHNPREVIFIDDKAENIAAARDAGLVAIQFKTADQVENVLKQQYGFDFAPKEV